MSTGTIALQVCAWIAHPSLGRLEALAWGELDTARARRALRHVRSCSRCRGRLAWIRRLPATLERATSVAPRVDARTVIARRERGDRVILPARGPDRSIRTLPGGPGHPEPEAER